jgi:peptide deformylase
LINPKILRKKGKQTAFEGCLSLPGLELEIKRPQKVEVEYCVLDKKEKIQSGSLGKIGDFQKRKIKTEGLAARIICHEIDHLDGKTILDRISLFKRLALKRKLKKN